MPQFLAAHIALRNVTVPDLGRNQSAKWSARMQDAPLNEHVSQLFYLPFLVSVFHDASLQNGFQKRICKRAELLGEVRRIVPSDAPQGSQQLVLKELRQHKQRRKSTKGG